MQYVNRSKRRIPDRKSWRSAGNWCSYAGADLAGSSRPGYPADVKIIRVPLFLPRESDVHPGRAFEKEPTASSACGCHPGDCHLQHRKLLREKAYDSAIFYAGLHRRGKRTYPCREWVSAAEGVKFSTTMNEFVEKIRSLGKNVRLEDLRCRK